MADAHGQPNRDVLGFFLGRFRVLCYDLIEGTRDYETQSTTIGHIQHDYEGRFVMELIQNADDAAEPGGKVAILLDQTQTPPLAIVANTGHPFTRDDVDDIRNIGLSRKDANRCIGNKGLGFRSVLQVTRNPRIFSVRSGDPASPGYCFGFSDSTRQAVHTALMAVRDGGDLDQALGQSLCQHLSESVFAPGHPALPRLADRLREDPELIERVTARIEPNIFPLPVDPASGPYQAHIAALWRGGFSTVVVLPLDAAAGSVNVASAAIQQLDECTLLFLRRVKELSVTTRDPEGEQRRLYRVTARRAGRLIERTIEEQEGSEPPRRRSFLLSLKTVRGPALVETQTEPGSRPPGWKLITKARVALAVELGEPRDTVAGMVSIGLPTAIGTGSGLWLDAPFEASISRKHVDFGVPYNQLLLREAMSALPGFIERVAARGEERAFVGVLSALAFFGDATPVSAAVPLEDLRGLPFILRAASDGVGAGQLLSPEEAEVLPDGPQAPDTNMVLTTQALAAYLRLPDGLYGQGDERPALLDCVLRRFGSGLPDYESLAHAAEIIAAILADDVKAGRRPAACFGTFFTELASWFGPGQRRLLEGRRIVPDTDSGLHRAGDVRPAVFELLQRVDDEDALTRLTQNLPASLRPFVAFVHPDALGARPAPGAPLPATIQFLRDGAPRMVQEFATEPLVTRALIPAMEAHADDEMALAQLLCWALNLWLAPQEKATTDRVRWREVRVPTRAGWRKAGESYLSADWDESDGALLEDALAETRADGSVRPFLIPWPRFRETVRAATGDQMEPNRERWTRFVGHVLSVNRSPQAIVQTSFTGNPPPNECGSRWDEVHAEELGNALQLPDPVWEAFTQGVRRHAIHVAVRVRKRCAVSAFHSIDGFGELTPQRGVAFFRLVARHYEVYRAHLTTVLYRKDGSARSVSIPSTLSAILQHSSWLPIEQGSGEVVLAPPGECVLVDPQDLPGPRRPPNPFSLLPHLHPQAAAEPAAAQLVEQGGGLVLDRITAVQGCRLLGQLAGRFDDIGQRSLARGLWQELLRRTAEAFAASPPADADALGREGWSAVLVDSPVAGNRTEEALVLEQELAEVGPLYVIDGPHRAAPLRHLLKMVVFSGEPEGTVRLLQARFGNAAVRRVSELRLIPYVDGAVEEFQDSTGWELLTEKAHWLELTTLAVLAYGRPSRMSLDSREFGRYVEMLQAARVRIVGELQVRIDGAEGAILPEPCFADPERRTILVADRHADDLRGVLACIATYLNVQDLAAAAFDAISCLPGETRRLGLRVHPDETHLETLLCQRLIGPQEYRRFCQRLQEDTDWYMRRVLPCLLALAPEDHPVADAEAVAVYLKAFQYARRHECLASTWLTLYQDPMPAVAAEFLRRADNANDQKQAARLAYEVAGVELPLWNSMQAVVTPGGPVVWNPDADQVMNRVHADLYPVALALLREHLVQTRSRGVYRSRRRGIESLKRCPPDVLEAWAPGLEALVRPLAESLADTGPSDCLPDWAARILPLPGETSAADIRRRIEQDGSDVRDNDDLVADANRDRLGPCMLDELRTAAVAKWLRDGGAGDLPGALCAAVLTVGLGQEAEEQLLSLLDFAPMAEPDCMAWLGEWWVAHGLAAIVGALPAVGTPADLPGAWGLDDGVLARARERLCNERLGIHRRRPVLTVLGADYEIPEEGLYQGLREIVDGRFDPAAQPDFDPVRPARLSSLEPSRVPGHPTDGGKPRLPRATREDEVLGALGEYLVWRKIQDLSGGRVRKEAWCSGNRSHFLADGLPGDDEWGYDFAFQLAGIRYEIEVKTTRSKQATQVRLGPTEVQRAEYRARQTRGPVWQIWLVTDALADPVFHALGNPFADEHKSRFEVLQMGVMLRFRLQKE